MTRLRWKLLAAMVALVAVTLGTTALFTRRVAHEEVRRLLVHRIPVGPDDVVRPLEEHVRATGGLAGAQAVLDRIPNAIVVLAGPNREVIAVSGELRSARVAVEADDLVTARGPSGEIVVRVPSVDIRGAAGQPVAHAYVLPAEGTYEPLAQRELAAVDRRLIALFGIAMLAALALTFLVSRRITKPIEQLTTAVQEMARGATPAPVPVTGRDELARLAASFNAMAGAVAAQEELRRRMVGDVAHELRTPLTNLRCELEAIQDGLAPADPSRIGSLHEEVLHLQRLVEDLQELALADAGALRLQRERVELSPLVARIAGERAEVELADGLAVDADPTRLRQVLDNLLANAAAHGKRVRVCVARRGDEAAVSVTDDGPGIPPAELERVFERFYRIDEARGRERGGAGLGLAIVRRLIELHGGRVWAESAPGAGATVTFTLPVASS